MTSPIVPPRPLAVLIGDDDADTATSLAEVLAFYGHVCAVALDGTEALRQVARCSPDVVLLDIWMPGLDGFAVARAIRERAADGPRPFLVAVTGYENSAAGPSGDRALFDLYLLKPVEPAVIVGVLERIRRFLSQSDPGDAPDEPHGGRDPVPDPDPSPCARALALGPVS